MSPKGSGVASKVGRPSFASNGFQPRPPGINYFRLTDGQTAVVRFVQSYEDIHWARKWKLPPSAAFRYGEEVNAVDQHDDGTSDPGVLAGLRAGFRAYPLLIWRNQVQYARDAQGRFIKDSLDNKQPAGFADSLAVWECSYSIYEMLGEKEGKYKSLTAFDWEIRRIGADKNTRYSIEPADPTNLNQPITPADQQIIATQHIDVPNIFTKVPTYDELNAYLNPGAAAVGQPAPSLAQQVQVNMTPEAAANNPFIADASAQAAPSNPNPFI